MILDMDKFSGLKGSHPEDKGPDMSPWFRKACNEGAISVQLGLGAYWLREPVEINYGVLGVNKSASGIAKDFPSDADFQGALTVRNLYGARFADFSMCSTVNSQRNNQGTGALLSFIPRSKAVTGEAYDEQVSYWTIDSLNFTSRAQWPKSAYHMHGLYCDGSYAGKAWTTCIRNGLIRDTTSFGTELGGYSVLLRSCSGIRLEGGGITSSAGKVAVLRLDGTSTDYAQTANSLIAPNGCMRIELSNVRNIQIMSPIVEGDVVRGPNADGIWGVGRLGNNGKPVGSWGPGTGAVWQNY